MDMHCKQIRHITLLNAVLTDGMFILFPSIFIVLSVSEAIKCLKIRAPQYRFFKTFLFSLLKEQGMLKRTRFKKSKLVQMLYTFCSVSKQEL